MDRAYESNASATAPAPPSPPLLGYPSDTGTPTVPGAWWYHMITESLRALVVLAGIAPDATNLSQVGAAVQALIASAIAALNLPAWTTAATANTLALRDGSAGLTSASFNVSSDASLKERIVPIRGALARLDLYPAVTYRRKGTGADHAGFIAGDFAKARPEGIRKDKNGKDAIDVMAVVAELHAALREERDARGALEARLAALEGKAS